jgi:NTE family protein
LIAAVSISADMCKTNGSIALVLGGGGARGLAHIGVIRWLEEKAVPVDAIVGTSIGALIGGLYASGTSVADMDAVIKKTDKLTMAKILRPGFSASGIIDDSRVRKFLKSFVGETMIEKLPIPFRAVATDLISGEEVVFDKGPLAEAILASSAIPALFMPVYHEGRYFVDGGLSNPLPVSIAQRASAAPTVAVNVWPRPESVSRLIRNEKGWTKKHLEKMVPAWMADVITEKGLPIPEAVLKAATDGRKKPSFHSPTLLHVVLQSISISTYNLIVQRLLLAKPGVLISPKVEEYGILEFYKGGEIVQRGYDAAEQSLAAVLSMISPA